MNEPLHNFVIEFREPATTVALWAELRRIRGWSKADDLPDTFERLADELRLLAIAGKIECVDGKWWVVVKARPKERMLFA